MENFCCKLASCGQAFASFAELDEHSVRVHRSYICKDIGCADVFKDKKSMDQHHKSKHLGYIYYCSGCGNGGWSRPGPASDHRKSHEACRHSVTLELHPGVGVFFGGRRYTGVLSGELLVRDLATRGQPLGELGQLARNELLGLGNAQAELVAHTRPPVARPSTARLRSSTATGSGDQRPVPGLVPVRLPHGLFCTLCPLDPIGMYISFPTLKLLLDHYAFHHSDGTLFVNECGDESDPDIELSSSDDDASSGVEPLPDMPVI